jgi:hypothetical protein
MASSSSDQARLDEILARLEEGGVDVTGLRKSRTSSETPGLFAASAEQVGTWASAVTSAVITAATRGAFLPSDLGLSPSFGTARNVELDNILAQSEVVLTDAQKAWQLRPEARRSILQRARLDGRLTPAAESGPEEDEQAKSRDGEGRLLRQLLAGSEPDLRTVETADLMHLATISQWLTGTSLAKLPPTKELRRLIALREQLDPFRTLVGRTLAAGSDGSQDRFVGRTQELERLRQYVGIVPPEQLVSYVNRAWGSLWTTLSRAQAGNEPLRIEGIGGMGKSTLLAKFVLDHALFPGVNLPFVYLDFDRAALAPRQPMQLLIDIALQIEPWFPDLEPQLRELRDHLRTSIDGLAGNLDRRTKEEQTRTELRACCESLRRIVESVNQERAPVVMLFDTFEVVQYDQEAVNGVLSLIAALQTPAAGPWPNLRIVVAGRAEMPEIESSHKPVKLDPLSFGATAELIRRRNESESLGLASAQIEALARPLRNSPLDVAIVLNWLRGREPSERGELVKSMLAEAAGTTGTQDQRANGPLAARRNTGVLINRMVNHINDRDVRRLVIPGLVVRAVTPEVIRYVMAPACGLSALEPNAENQLFNRLERERWLVTRRGDAIRHRPEVRAAMLDLLRQQDFAPDRSKDRATFSETNAMAIAFFRERAPGSSEARAECIYHMLLGGRTAFKDIDDLWTSEVASFLQNAVDDLIGLSETYLRFKLGRQVTPEEIVQLSDRVPSLLATAGQQLFRGLPPETTLNLLSRTQNTGDLSANFGLRLEALYRTGRWDELERLCSGPRIPESTLQALMSLGKGDFKSLEELGEDARLALSISLRWGARGRNPISPFVGDFARDGETQEWVLQIEDIGWDLTVFMLCASVRARAEESATGSAYEVTGTRLLDRVATLCRSRKRLPRAATESGALRILAFFETGAERAVLRRVDFQNHFSVVNERERQQLEEIVSGDNDLGESDAGREAIARGRSVLERMSSLDRNVVIADTSMTAQFVATVKALAEAGDERVAQSLLRMLSLKHPDWLEPMGHALTRAFQGNVPTRLGLWSSVETYFGSGGRRRQSKALSSGHEILSLADEAAHLREALGAYDELVQKQSRNDDVRQFRALVQAFDNWSAMLREKSVASAKSGSSQLRSS